MTLDSSRSSRALGEPGGASRAAEKNAGLTLLFSACMAKAVIPGAVNFAQQPHPVAGMESSYEFTALAGRVSSFLSVLLILACLRTLIRSGRVQVPGTILLFLGFAILTQARMTPDWLGSRGLTSLFLYAIVIISISVARPTKSDLRVVGAGVTLLATGSLAFAVLAPGNAQFLIGGDGVNGTKALVGSYVLAGPMTHSNTLGLAVALGLPFVSLMRGAKVRRLSFATCLVVVLLSASRTSMLALAVWALFRMLERVVRDLRSPFFRGSLIAAVGASVAVLPFTVADREAFSTRAGLWQDGIAAWRSSGSITWGLGPYWGTTGVVPGTATSSSAHNLVVQWLVSGGLCLLLAGTLVLAVATKRAVRADNGGGRPVLTAYMCILLVVSSTEYVLPPTISSQLFPVTGFVLACVLSIERRAHSDHQIDAGAGTRLVT